MNGGEANEIRFENHGDDCEDNPMRFDFDSMGSGGVSDMFHSTATAGKCPTCNEEIGGLHVCNDPTFVPPVIEKVPRWAQSLMDRLDAHGKHLKALSKRVDILVERLHD